MAYLVVRELTDSTKNVQYFFTEFVFHYINEQHTVLWQIDVIYK